MGCFMEKMKFQRKTLFIFIFYLGTVSRETGEKIEAFLRYFWHQKIKLADGLMGCNWHKIMKPPDSVRKKKYRLRRGH